MDLNDIRYVRSSGRSDQAPVLEVITRETNLTLMFQWTFAHFVTLV